ncbi:MAG: MBL fold metallo-hydrolase [Eggerthellaceae bacterium]|jgi:flavorubredoxin
MHCEHELVPGLYWIGGDDHRTPLFEGHHPVPHGMAYNNYLLLDEKTVLFDTIDRAVEERFLETVEHLLDGRPLDYIVINHMEPDHSATLGAVAARHPEAALVCTATAKQMVKQFFGPDLAERVHVVDDGDTLDTGARTLTFLKAPMVHWPEVMVTYDADDRILLSADAFGSFGALDGRLFDSDYDFDAELLDENRRYYANIVGKYGTQVTDLLDKLDGHDVDLICPLHGPLVRDNITRLIGLYRTWAAYRPEDAGVVIAYASIYGGTRDVAEKLAFKLSDRGVNDLALFDVSVTDPSYILSEAFRVGTVVLASVTYNAGVFPKMQEFIEAMAAHNLRHRRFAIIQNGSWGPIAGRLMTKAVEAIPDSTIVGDMLTIKSRMTDAQEPDLDALADAIAAAVRSEDGERADAAGETAVDDAAAAGVAAGAAGVAGTAAAPGADPTGTVSASPAGRTGAAPAPSANRASAAATPADGRTGTASAPAGNRSGAAAVPLTPPPARDLPPVPGAANTKVMQVWRCTFCGYQAEVPKGTDMSTFVCPICFHSGEGRFVLVREKVVPA